MLDVLDLLGAGLPFPAAASFSTRRGGTSLPPYDGTNLSHSVGDDWDRVHANRDLLGRALGVSGYGGLAFAQQVHGAGVHLVAGPPTGRLRRGIRGVDALVTAEPGIALVVLGADCLPVLLVDPEAAVIGAAHAGRRGLVAGVLPAVLARMADLGARADRVQAVVGPGVCGACYEVPAELAEQVEDALPGSRTTSRAGTPAVDLRAAAHAVLGCAGVGLVRDVGGCTAEQPERWYSHRRDGLTGRHAGAVVLREPRV